MDERRRDDDDNQLWRDYTRDVAPLTPSASLRPSPAQPARPGKVSSSRPPRGAGGIVPHAPVPNGTSLPQGRELDGRTDRKLVRGRIAIEARIDLHGLGQAEAQARLTSFLLRARSDGLRCVLVITGKGRRVEDGGDAPRGVLRARLADWLELPALRPYILKLTQATPKDGGAGAFYIYLRRERIRE